MVLFPQPQNLELLDGVYEMPIPEMIGDLAAFFREVQKGLSGINVVNFDCSKTAVERICEICTDMGINHHVGTIATGDRFVASQTEKDRIVSLFNGIACDMEGGAIAQACYINNVPFSAIRALSDDADSGSPSDFGEFCRKSAENSAEVVRRFIEKY
jgi:adenosylhomocysteine nucleosidase